MANVDAFRIGMGAVGVAAAVVVLTKVLPVLIEVLWGVVPAILILAFISWVLKALVEKIFS